MKASWIGSVAVIVAVAVIGAGYLVATTQTVMTPQNPPVSHSGPVRDYVSLVDALRAKGFKVEPTEKISQPFFSVEAQTIDVVGRRLQVYEYATEKAMNEEAAKVSPDGTSVGNSKVSWIEPPHFYKVGRILVLYIGTDSNVINVLDEIIGPQFAGSA